LFFFDEILSLNDEQKDFLKHQRIFLEKFDQKVTMFEVENFQVAIFKH
jgi:hypothetical protein